MESAYCGGGAFAHSGLSYANRSPGSATSGNGPLPQFASAKRASAMKGSAVAGVAGTQMHERRSLTAYTHVFESLLGIRTGAQNGVSQIAKCPYKIVRPKLNVSQNKSLILFTQGTPTPSRHGAVGNPIGSLGLARDKVSFTTPGVCAGNRRAFGALRLSHR